MECLHCGDCCLRMSPKMPSDIDGNNKRCTDLIEKEGYFFCSNYKNRPQQCANHDFPSRFCPIGLTKLGINVRDLDSIRYRIDHGYELSKNLK